MRARFGFAKSAGLSFKNVKAKPADFPKDENANLLLYAAGDISG